MTLSTVTYKAQDRIGTITLNRPEKMNSLSQELLFELNDALHDLHNGKIHGRAVLIP